jgi:AbrB family looped-hinge helix DNA binding protein
VLLPAKLRFLILVIMRAKVTLDKKGRALIPKRMRDELGIGPGDSIQMESSEEQIVLRPVRDEGKMFKKDGVWVFRGGKPLTLEATNAVLQALRDERDAQNLGEM